MCNMCKILYKVTHKGSDKEIKEFVTYKECIKYINDTFNSYGYDVTDKAHAIAHQFARNLEIVKISQTTLEVYNENLIEE